MKYKVLSIGLCLLLQAMLVTSCYDDLDFDKFSDEVEVSPSLILPMAKSDVTAKYLFDEVDNCVEYFIDSDGDECITLRSDYDSLVAYSVFDLIGLNCSGLSFETSVDASPYSSYISSSFYGDSVTVPLRVELPLQAENANISSLNIDYMLMIIGEGFTVPASLEMMLGGLTSYCNDKELVNGKMFAYQGKDVTINDNKIVIDIKLKVATGKSGQLGKLNVSLNVPKLNSATGSIDKFTMSTQRYIQMTGMYNFRRFANNIEFRNPVYKVTYSNSTDLQFDLMPNVLMVDRIKEWLQLRTDVIEITPNEKSGEVPFDRNNSNVLDIFNAVPDSILYECNIDVSMSDDVDELTLYPTDSLYLGYSYDIPVEFKIDSNDKVYVDTMSISDMPSLDDLNRGKLIFSSENSLPVTVGVGFIPYDSRTKRTFTPIVAEAFATAPRLDEKGKSVESVLTNVSVELSSQQIKELAKADELIVQLLLDSSGEKYVVPKTDDRFAFTFSIALEFELSTND